jgi:hypothetical protein
MSHGARASRCVSHCAAIGESHVEDSVRDKARALIEQGRVAVPLPARRWAGRGNGARCLVCGMTIRPDEIDIEFEPPADVHDANDHFHVHCLSTVEDVFRELPGGAMANAPRCARSADGLSPDGSRQEL